AQGPGRRQPARAGQAGGRHRPQRARPDTRRPEGPASSRRRGAQQARRRRPGAEDARQRPPRLPAALMAEQVRKPKPKLGRSICARISLFTEKMRLHKAPLGLAVLAVGAFLGYTEFKATPGPPFLQKY